MGAHLLGCAVPGSACVPGLSGLRRLLKAAFFTDQRAVVLRTVIDGLFRALLDDKTFWLPYARQAGLKMGRGGLHRLILDVRFLATAAQPFVSAAAAAAAKEFERKAVSIYLGASGQIQSVPDGVLMPEAWFTAKPIAGAGGDDDAAEVETDRARTKEQIAEQV